tara:strand:- start:109 stop:1374 length:1266 start_codon:yes stop_codon:yes gene_type:complete
MKFRILFFLLLINSYPFFGQIPINNLVGIESISNINTEFFEYNGYINKNKNFIFFNRSNDPNNVGGIKDQGDVWYSKKVFDNLWTSPENMLELNDQENNLLLGVENQNIIVFTNGEVNIYNITDTGTKLISNSFIKYYKSNSNILSGSISEDKKLIVLSIDSYGSYGVEDLYVSKKINDSTWSSLINLGSSINTSYQETYPYLSSDNSRVFFSSNGYDGYGGFDIFYSDRQDDSWKQWSQPINLGNKINSEGSENSFIYDSNSNIISFSSSINSIGNSDLKFYYLNLNKNDLPSSDITNFSSIEDGQKIILNKVFFYQSSHELLNESFDQLDLIFNFLNKNQNLTVFLEGHTDNIGNAKKNLELSGKRVQTVKNYLITKGINKKRIDGKGFGGERPLISNKSSSSNKLNRRVEIIFNNKLD